MNNKGTLITKEIPRFRVSPRLGTKTSQILYCTTIDEIFLPRQKIESELDLANCF